MASCARAAGAASTAATAKASAASRVVTGRMIPERGAAVMLCSAALFIRTRATGGDDMELDPQTAPPESIYKLLIGCVVPRPIAWVSTLGADGVHNLAPFSFFMGVCQNPPTIAFSSGPPGGGPEGHGEERAPHRRLRGQRGGRPRSPSR